MRCFSCQAEIEEAMICPVCNADQTVYKRILFASNETYNRGLEKAKMRDLTGAIDMLQKSLRFDKRNIDARNLLGLVYFETGQVVLAIREWVLSKNFQPKNNIADDYLNRVQKPGVLNKLDSVTQKYNQALEYCKNGSPDLARIQLKRVISDWPNMVSAYQLLAVIMMHDGKYEEAGRYISQAEKIDYKNSLTMYYGREIRSKLQENPKKRKRKKKTDNVVFTEANDVSYAPRNQFIEVFDSAGAGIINVIIGVVLGILAAVFLIVPTMRQNDNSSAANALVTANQEATDSANNVATLQTKVESLEEELSNYTGKGDMQTSYEKLLEAKTKMDEGDVETAVTSIETVNRDLLDTNGQALYDSLNTTINDAKVTLNYDKASDAYYDKKYDEAAPLFQSVVDINPAYDDGYALYYLAECYEEIGDTEKAVTYYTQFINDYPGTKRATTAKNRIEDMTGTEFSSSSTTTNTNTNNTTTNNTNTNTTDTTEDTETETTDDTEEDNTDNQVE